jgi:hypothetical protein
VLVHADEEVHIVAKKAVITRDYIGADLFECVTLVRVSGCIVDRAGEEILRQLRVTGRAIVTAAPAPATAPASSALVRRV